jgi:hypothetical protein
MAGRAATPQGRKLGNINNMPNRKYLLSINFSVPFARWSHFYVSIDWTTTLSSFNAKLNVEHVEPRVWCSCFPNNHVEIVVDKTLECSAVRQ